MEKLPTPYAELNSVLADLAQSVRTILGGNFVGAYLQGSFAVGDFDAHSDVDFIVVVKEELAEGEVAALHGMHERVYGRDSAWAQHLEGSYYPQRALRQHAERDAWLWFLDHGSSELIQSAHCNTIVVRWVLREHGVTLAGPAPVTLVDAMPVVALRGEILAKMRKWGDEILAHPDEYNNRFYQSYVVLQYCRMLHDLHTGYPGSKRAGAEWAKAHLDAAWVGLIDRTWAGRPNPAVAVRERADLADFAATLEFVRYMLNEARRYARRARVNERCAAYNVP
ncbi:MAG: hypothetical protein OJF49_002942 [Ktedonobacterales bacterium]|nr:MAG: hypothetical protein OJF49_002942 [Ktedonobacterales bacterium]